MNNEVSQAPVASSRPSRAGSGMRLLIVIAAAVLLGAMLDARAGSEPPDYPGALTGVDGSAPLHAAR